MQFYEDYIPLVELYPYTFCSTPTCITPVSTVSMSTFVPPTRLEDQWEDLLEIHENFMSSNPAKLTRKAASLVKIATAWVRLFLWFREFLLTRFRLPSLTSKS